MVKAPHVQTNNLQVFFITQCGATIAAVNYGYGRPLETMNLEQASQALEVRLFAPWSGVKQNTDTLPF
jgi:hypothetical protein